MSFQKKEKTKKDYRNCKDFLTTRKRLHNPIIPKGPNISGVPHWPRGVNLVSYVFRKCPSLLAIGCSWLQTRGLPPYLSFAIPWFHPSTKQDSNLGWENASFSSCITESQPQLSWRPLGGFSQGHCFHGFLTTFNPYMRLNYSSCSITQWSLPSQERGLGKGEKTHRLKWKRIQWNSQTNTSASIKHSKLYLAQRMYSGCNKKESSPQQKEEEQEKSKQEQEASILSKIPLL